MRHIDVFMTTAVVLVMLTMMWDTPPTRLGAPHPTRLGAPHPTRLGSSHPTSWGRRTLAGLGPPPYKAGEHARDQAEGLTPYHAVGSAA